MRRALALVACLCVAAPVAMAQRVPLVWHVTGGDGHEAWLVGTMHALAPSDSVLHPVIADAYARASVVAFEVDPETMAADAAARMARAAMDPRPLASALPASTRRRLAERLASAGLRAEAFEGLRPWAIALVVADVATASVGLDAAFGLDARLHARARADGRRTAALETVGDQIAALASPCTQR